MFFYHPLYSQLDLPQHHRFPINKYAQLHTRLIQKRLIKKAIHPNKATLDQITLCHDKNYVANFINGTLDDKTIKKMGVPWSTALVERTLYSIGASIEAATYALDHGAAVNLSGGYHHAHHDFGAGFCIFNDLAIAACALIEQGRAGKVVIFDCDVHQGDGTAAILGERADVTTCSIHCEYNFPRSKAISDYDFALPSKTQDQTYLETVTQALNLVCRIHQPDLLLYNAGADIFTKDELGMFDISLEGVQMRDKIVIEYCQQNALPLMAAMGGGYQRDLSQLIDVHEQFFIALINKPAMIV
ncbi:histone deacetylase family protein [Pseudoalteromonas sp. S16_S37]|uniref:histone deacetylase family protein n=1 Tax=Pseudoalteromonas sp. S16_S37 TaxID=2720228 RepID=UPI00167FEED7|nr:histone deacetylase [Pseudoalteromonas sp. S16_S37]MBD1582573.1 histone deacetylase [Pseudoalteromonas sp. S16_S37]